MMDKDPLKKNIMSVKFSLALFSLLCTHDDLVMQSLLWLHLVRFRTIQFGVAWLGPSYANLR